MSSIPRNLIFTQHREKVRPALLALNAREPLDNQDSHLPHLAGRGLFVLKSATMLVLLCLAFLTASAQAPPSADSIIVTARPNQNYGNSTILAVANGITTLIQFNLSGIPANTNIQKATLRLYVDGFQSPGSFDVYELAGSWSENSVKFTNAPALGTSATGGNPTPIARSSLNNFVLVDITALAQGWLTGTIANNGLALP